MAIRMSNAEAKKLGLLDPLLAGRVVPSPAAPKKRSKRMPRPAARVVPAGQREGTGRLVLDGGGLIREAAFRFDLVPVPKERPRVVSVAAEGEAGDDTAKSHVTYTPMRTKAYTKAIRTVVSDEMRGKRGFSGPITMTSIFVFEPPSSWPKWKGKAAINGLIVPTKRPDIDNLEKAVLDAVNEKLFDDDTLVIEKRRRKIYGPRPAIFVHALALPALNCSVSPCPDGLDLGAPPPAWLEETRRDMASIDQLISA